MTLTRIFIPIINTIICGLLFIFAVPANSAVEPQQTSSVAPDEWTYWLFRYSFGDIDNATTIPSRRPEPENYIELDPTAQQASVDPALQSILNMLRTQTECTSDNANCLSQQALVNTIIGGDIVLEEWLDAINVPPSLSARSLLAPHAYSAEATPCPPGTPVWACPGGDSQAMTAESANQFINYITSNVTIFPHDEDFITAMQELEYMRGGERARAIATASRYLAERYSYAALASVIIDNLYYLHEKRLPDSDGVSQQEAEFLSAAQYDQAWRDELTEMPQKQVLETIAILLAEQQKQNYLRGEENDRILAALSASTLLKLQEAKYQIIYDTTGSQ